MKLLISFLALMGCAVAQAGLGTLFVGNGAGITNLTLGAHLITVAKSGGQYSTITAAKAVAVAGDLIEVYPGAYNENDLLKVGVNYRFLPGASVSYTNVGTGQGWGIFDDRAIGATTNVISGAGEFYCDGFTNLASGATIFLTNANTRFFCEAKSVGFSTFTDPGVTTYNFASVRVNSCVYCDFKIGEIYDPYYGVSIVLGKDEFDQDVTGTTSATGVFWARGEMHIKVAHIGLLSGYGVWLDGASSTADNFWITADAIDTHSYVSTGGPGWRSWWNVKEMSQNLSLFGGGKHYLTVEKILGGVSGAVLDINGAGGEFWVDSQKVTAVNDQQWLALANGIVHVKVQHWEDLGTNSQTTAMINNSGGTLFIEGGHGSVNTRPGISHSGGTSSINGLTLTTLTNASKNIPVTVSAAGLSLTGCKFISPTTVSNSIYSATAQTVGVYWSAATTNVSPNVTVSPNSGLSTNSITSFGSVSGDGSLLTGLNATSLGSGTVPLARLPYTSLTNFTSYASGTAYTLTGTSAQLDFGTTDPIVTINQAGTYLLQANVGVKYSGATYANAQTVTFKFRRTNNTAADLTSGSRTVEMPFLVAGAAFTGGDVMTLPPIIYTATSGDTVGVFGILSATPPAGSVTTDSCEIVAIRLY